MRNLSLPNLHEPDGKRYLAIIRPPYLPPLLLRKTPTLAPL